MNASNQRLLDLVRQQRMELHEVGLITDREYADLAADSGAVARLETYDQMRAELAALRCSKDYERGVRACIQSLEDEAEMSSIGGHITLLAAAAHLRTLLLKIENQQCSKS